MKWKRIKCFLTGGHRLYDKNLQTIHDTNGYHFINYCAVKKEVYNWDGVESVVATALMHENKVVINANW